MTTLANVIEEARGHLNAGTSEHLNKLASSAGSGATSLVMSNDLAGIVAGARIAVGLEDFHVWTAAAASKTVTVQPGFNGSSQAAHTAGDLVWVKPRFSPWDIFKALRDDLVALSSPENGLFRVVIKNLTAVSGTTAYDITDADTEGLLQVLKVELEPSGSAEDWIPTDAWRHDDGADTADFASGHALVLWEQPTGGKKIRVHYAADYSALPTTLTDDVETETGIQTSVRDILAIGAALRLMGDKPLRRAAAEWQGEPRRAEEVTVGDIVNAAAVLRVLRRDRITEERMRLRRLYPWRRRRI